MALSKDDLQSLGSLLDEKLHPINRELSFVADEQRDLRLKLSTASTVQREIRAELSLASKERREVKNEMLTNFDGISTKIEALTEEYESLKEQCSRLEKPIQ